MTELDSDYLNRAAPPGSMRYFALLYTPAEQQNLLAALFVIEAEIRSSANQTAHEVAHTRLHWWRAEIDRLVNRNAQHPATRVLQAALPHTDFSGLHELIVAADLDLARMTYQTRMELDAYLERSGSVLAAFAGMVLVNSQEIRALGALLRRVETLRDLAGDARAGRIYWPLAEAAAHGVTVEVLQLCKPTESLQRMLATEVTNTSKRLQQLIAALSETALRPIIVLAQLHRKLLQRIERSGYDVFLGRHELKPFEKVWTAWRAARKLK